MAGIASLAPGTLACPLPTQPPSLLQQLFVAGLYFDDLWSIVIVGAELLVLLITLVADVVVFV